MIGILGIMGIIGIILGDRHIRLNRHIRHNIGRGHIRRALA